MRRTLYLVAGAVLAFTSFTTLFLEGPLSVALLAGYALLGVGGLLFVVASRLDEVDVGSHTYAWYQLVGVGDVTLGLGFPLTVVQPVIDGSAGTIDYLLLVGGTIGGLLLVIIGLDMARGGEYVRVDDRSG